MKITQTIATNNWTFSSATGLTYNITSNANTYQRNDGTFSSVSPKSNILPSKLSFVKRYKHNDYGWCYTQVEPWPNNPGDTRSEDPSEGEEAYFGYQFSGSAQWYKVSCIYHNEFTEVTCVEYRANIETDGCLASIDPEDNKKINFYQSANYTFNPIIAYSGWTQDLGGGFTAATEAGSVIAYAKFTPSNTNIKVDNTDLASLCEPKEMSESLNFTAVDNGGNYHFPTNRDLSIFAKSIPGIPAITSGKLKNSGVDVNIAGLGERPIAEELCRIITPGTYSILRTDSSLTIGSNTYTASDFRDKVIPKVMGVLLVGGGGGGGGGSSSHSQGSGSGGGGGAITYGLIDFRQTNQAINVVIPNGGAYGVMDNNGIDGPSTYLAKNSSPILLAAGGKGGLCCQENTRKPGGAGGLASQSEFSVLPAIFVRAQDGGQGGSSCSGDESKPLSGPTMTYTTNNCWGNESFCNFSHESVCDTEGNTHSGGGGSGGASWGDGPRGSWNDHIGPDGTLGSGGSGGPRKALIGPQEHGSKGGDGLAIFYY